MINILVGNNEVTVENRLHRDFNNREDLANMLQDVIERCLYSGESIILRVDTINNMAKVRQEWVNPHVSNRYKRIKE